MLELALGSLMRGELRASEMRVVGPRGFARPRGERAVRMARRAHGLRSGSVADRESRDRGRPHRVARRRSGTDAALEGFWFKGDLRSLIGPVKGEGGFIAAGERYGYRLAASRAAEDGMKIKLALDPSDHPLAIEADGALRLEDSLAALRRLAHAGASGRGRRRQRTRHRRGAVARHRQGEGRRRPTRCSSSSNISTGPRRAPSSSPAPPSFVSARRRVSRACSRRVRSISIARSRCRKRPAGCRLRH